MTRFKRFSLRKILRSVLHSFGEILLEDPRETSGGDRQGLAEPAPSLRARLRVSMDDLKIISSALLHFKKSLLKRDEAEKAQQVSSLDNRIYTLIRELEREQEERARALEEKQVAA